uniref:Uncharacterized protein n=1 Tax=Physcomitrium patens TaxID=3218 RepID=A0A7I4CTK1_PHYPA
MWRKLLCSRSSLVSSQIMKYPWSSYFRWIFLNTNNNFANVMDYPEASMEYIITLSRRVLTQPL